jgi:hypothetical protein
VTMLSFQADLLPSHLSVETSVLEATACEQATEISCHNAWYETSAVTQGIIWPEGGCRQAVDASPRVHSSNYWAAWTQT